MLITHLGQTDVYRLWIAHRGYGLAAVRTSTTRLAAPAAPTPAP